MYPRVLPRHRIPFSCSANTYSMYEPIWPLYMKFSPCFSRPVYDRHAVGYSHASNVIVPFIRTVAEFATVPKSGTPPGARKAGTGAAETGAADKKTPRIRLDRPTTGCKYLMVAP